MQEMELVELVESMGLDVAKKEYVLAQFQALSVVTAEWAELGKAILATSVSAEGSAPGAGEREMVLLRGLRYAVEEKKKELREQSAREVRAIDAVAKAIIRRVEPIEAHLSVQEHCRDLRLAANAALAQERAEKEKRIAENEVVELTVEKYELLNRELVCPSCGRVVFDKGETM